MSRPRRISAAVLTALAITAAIASAAVAQDQAWKPYLKDDKGKETPFPADPTSVSDKDWMFLRFTEYSGAKSRLAVMVAGNQKAEQQFWSWSDGTNSYKIPMNVEPSAPGVPVDGIEDLVTIALKNTNRFKLVEREKIANVQKEQGLTSSGDVSAQTAVPMGKIQGAQYLIETTVNEWNPEASKQKGIGGGLTSRFIAGAAGGRTKASIKMSFRIIDAATTEILDAVTETITMTSGWSLSPGFLFFGQTADVGSLLHLEGHPLMTNAVQACVNKGIYEIVTRLKDKPWSGKVMDVSGGDITINAGSGLGLKPGMELLVVAKGKDMTDPDTGKLIHTKGRSLGSILISDVQDDYSVAHAKSDCADCKSIKVGDSVSLKP